MVINNTFIVRAVCGLGFAFSTSLIAAYVSISISRCVVGVWECGNGVFWVGSCTSVLTDCCTMFNKSVRLSRRVVCSVWCVTCECGEYAIGVYKIECTWVLFFPVVQCLFISHLPFSHSDPVLFLSHEPLIVTI